MKKELWVSQTEEFLKDIFQKSTALTNDPSGRAYRLEHSYRVANIGKEIAQKEGFDATEMIIGCLLHDISYAHPMDTPEARRNHGRLSAKMARPFLKELGMPEDRIQEICYGIAIHVDGESDFEGIATPFAETICDADSIDRFDAYRLYENLETMDLRKMTLEEKLQKIDARRSKLQALKQEHFGTKTAQAMWKERLEFQISFYDRLKAQFVVSNKIL